MGYRPSADLHNANGLVRAPSVVRGGVLPWKIRPHLSTSIVLVMRCAFITGITGQDGSYLAELLLQKGYKVHGLVRRTSAMVTLRIGHLLAHPELHIHYGDITDGQHLMRLVLETEPDEIYNLAAQSHVRLSFDLPVYTTQTVSGGALFVLEAARMLQRSKEVRVYQASSSEMFGNIDEWPQTEVTRFAPQSPYACAKVHAFHQTVNYRDAFGLFAANGILFNHESPRRGAEFVTRKITLAAARIQRGEQEKLYLGNLDAARDWGYAGDYVNAMWRILQHDEPTDFVIATGVSHTVRDFLDETFRHFNSLEWQDVVETDSKLIRPTEVHHLVGDSSKAADLLGWKPQVDFEGLVKLMVEHDTGIGVER